jgi:hypothetical protein
MESVVDLVREFGHGEREISLLPYDGSSSVDKQGAEIIEECREKIDDDDLGTSSLSLTYRRSKSMII